MWVFLRHWDITSRGWYGHRGIQAGKSVGNGVCLSVCIRGRRTIGHDIQALVLEMSIIHKMLLLESRAASRLLLVNDILREL